MFQVENDLYRRDLTVVNRPGLGVAPPDDRALAPRFVARSSPLEETETFCSSNNFEVVQEFPEFA